MKNLYDVLKQLLDTSRCYEGGYVFPTILTDWPIDGLRKSPGQTVADVAIDYLAHYGFKADRTRMNLYGYPGLFRELNEPLSWTGASLMELRALYLHANETPISSLVDCYRKYLDKRDDLATEHGVKLPPELIQGRLELFEEKLHLARCIGTEDFEHLYEAIFDFDEFTPALGAPDLFVWSPEMDIWFFAEVKGPHDHLRGSQAAWLRANWEGIKGKFILLVVPPDA